MFHFSCHCVVFPGPSILIFLELQVFAVIQLACIFTMILDFLVALAKIRYDSLNSSNIALIASMFVGSFSFPRDKLLFGHKRWNFPRPSCVFVESQKPNIVFIFSTDKDYTAWEEKVVLRFIRYIDLHRTLVFAHRLKLRVVGEEIQETIYSTQIHYSDLILYNTVARIQILRFILFLYHCLRIQHGAVSHFLKLTENYFWLRQI